MEKLKNKHDHALTQWLKVIIFAILMLAPFFSVLSRCLYVTCNKNAKDSYYGENINQANKKVVSNNDELNNATTYYLDTAFLDYDYTTDYNFNLYVTGFDLVNNGNLSNTEVQNFNDYNIYRLIFGTSTNRDYRNLFVYYLNDNNESIWLMAVNLNNKFFVCSFNLLRMTSTDNTFDNEWLYTIEYNQYSFLDNAFEYSVNQLTQSQTFNWVTNTAIYQPVNAMTTGLGFDVNNNIVALLLTYWAILTAVYVLFDIIISCFVKLTHLESGSA